jgi:pimeloyl-ACP methyl ester carboxylesterase
MQTLAHRVPNGDGWQLSLHQTWHEGKLQRGRRPVLIVPGYGMNSFIFSYHPRGASLEGYLAEQGFEVWRADLRAQGESVSTGGGERFGLADLALADLGAAIDAVRERTRTGADRVDVIGASLGGTLLFIHVALRRFHHVGSMVAMGSPVRWVRIHPVVRAAFRSPLIAGAVRFRGTRKLVERLLPLLAKRVPWVLSVYMNPAITDLSAAREMVKTVEDPIRRVNRQIAHWINARDLIVRGVNVGEALRDVRQPLLVVLANGDGIVPRETALFPYQQIGSPVRAVLEVGSDRLHLAHADLFVSNEAHERVFAPIARWLAEPTPVV